MNGIRRALRRDGRLFWYGVSMSVKTIRVFVLGDNSAESYDSRYYSAIDENSIVSQYVKIVYPVDRLRPLIPQDSVGNASTHDSSNVRPSEGGSNRGGRKFYADGSKQIRPKFS